MTSDNKGNTVFFAPVGRVCDFDVFVRKAVEQAIQDFGEVGVLIPLSDTPNDALLSSILSDSKGRATCYVGAQIGEYLESPEGARTRIVDTYESLSGTLENVIVVGLAEKSALGFGAHAINSALSADLQVPLTVILDEEVSKSELAVEYAMREVISHYGEVSNVIVGGENPKCFSVSPSSEGAGPSQSATSFSCDAQLVKNYGFLIQNQGICKNKPSDLVCDPHSLNELLSKTNSNSLVILGEEAVTQLVGLSSSNVRPALVVSLAKPSSEVLEAWRRDAYEVPLWGVDESINAPKGIDEVRERILSLLEIVDVYKESPECSSENRNKVMTPARFQYWLFDQAKRAQRNIVLPEGDCDRVLLAADQILREKLCNLTILGNSDAVMKKAEELCIDLTGARIIDTEASELRERMARSFAELRKKKGVTYEDAYKTMANPSYFGTMLVQEGIVDGMVSGAVHTTADTIRPALQIIKTVPNVSVVSGAFLVSLDDRVLVYADCAVNPNPTSEQLAQIGVSSAETAKQFGLSPKLALLTYSTGTSGKGPAVDLIKEATAKLHALSPELNADGPLQYDAAIDPVVARTKAPHSAVAGAANVFVFPDLSAGNIVVKAVQRSTGCLAIGPILQGLRKPVNDLSRGATVKDIVNTVAVTAIQVR